MSRLDELAAAVAKEKRRTDRLGGLLITAERRYKVAVEALERELFVACNAPAQTRQRRDHKDSKRGLTRSACDKMPQEGNLVPLPASNDELHR